MVNGQQCLQVVTFRSIGIWPAGTAYDLHCKCAQHLRSAFRRASSPVVLSHSHVCQWRQKGEDLVSILVHEALVHEALEPRLGYEEGNAIAHPFKWMFIVDHQSALHADNALMIAMDGPCHGEADHIGNDRVGARS